MVESVKRTTLLLLLFTMPLFFNSLPTLGSVSAISKSVPSQGTISYYSAIPLLRGWGGIRLYETLRYTNEANDSPRTSPKSVVFPGEVASNAELTCLKIKTKGYNTVGVWWQPTTSHAESPDWDYNDAWLERFIKIAKALDMWILPDCHGYTDHYEFENEWISHWQHVISTFKDSYDKIVWEPICEPIMQWRDGSHHLTGQAAVDELTRIYQRWIDMCRSLGDAHWIVVSGICWWSSIPNFADWFPVVNDSLNKTFLTYHFYYFYEWESNWTVEGAEASADHWINLIKSVIAKHNRPFICTEMGAMPYSPGYEYDQVPTAQYGGASGYSTVSLAFVKRMVTHFHDEGIGYLLFPAGDWAKDWAPGWHYTGLYGGMDVWGDLL